MLVPLVLALVSAEPGRVDHGLYMTTPRDLRLCAEHHASRCDMADVSKIPDYVKGVMTNPVGLHTEDSYGPGYFRSVIDPSRMLPIVVGPTGELSYEGVVQERPLLHDPACILRKELLEVGTLTKAETVARVSLVIRVKGQLVGDCAQSLIAITQCYANGELCAVPLSEDIRETFDPFIEAGIVTLDELLELTSFSFQASYQ